MHYGFKAKSILSALLGLLLFLVSPTPWAKKIDESTQDSIVFGVHSHTAPLEWRDNGVEQGFNIQLLQRIAQMLNKQVVVRRKSFQELVADIRNTQSGIDIITLVSPVSVNRLLLQSDPIYTTHAKAYTLQGEVFIHNWQDLAGKRVAIKKGSFVDVYIRGKDQHFTPIDVDLYETGFKMLEENKVDVVLAENLVARRLQPLYPSVHSSSDALIYGAFRFVTNKRNFKLINQVNASLRQLKLSGEYDALVNKWFGTGREKVDLTSTQEKILWSLLVITFISAGVSIYTRSISKSLEKRTKLLDLELEQRKIAEQKLSGLSHQFQSVLDGIPHGVSLFNYKIECLWSNDNNNDLLRNAAFVHQNGDPFILAATVKKVIKEQQPIVAEMVFKQQYWQIQVYPIVTDQVVIFLEESTEEHRLRQANDEASRLASLGELSAGIAHEINNPTGIILHSIAFYSQALADLKHAIDHYQKHNPFWMIAGLKPDTALTELEGATHSIDDSARRISRIVNDLKRYAQPNITCSHNPTNINEVVQVSLRLTANNIKRFEVNTDFACPAPMIFADAQQLQQVMINLIQNACNAMASDLHENKNKAQGVLKLDTWADDKHAYIRITDNGCGMKQQTLSRVTEPFFTTRRAIGGSGLGLSVSSRILEEHQAQMLITSHPGKGTCIKLTFPLEQ